MEMKIVFYTDKNYEYQAQSLIESILLNSKEEIDLIYYTIGFESNLNYKNLTKKSIPLDLKKPRFEYYKPLVLVDSIQTFGEGNYLFLDSDIILGKRFTTDKFRHDLDYALMPLGNWEFPFVCKYINDIPQNVCDERNLMDYFGIKERTMKYVYTCIINYNDKCLDFLKEWQSINDNQYLVEKRDVYFPFSDETSMNILLWKRGINRNHGRLYLNTLKYEPLVYIEENERVQGDPNNNYGIMGNNLLRCENSSEILFYHGIKDKLELEKVLEYYKKNQHHYDIK